MSTGIILIFMTIMTTYSTALALEGPNVCEKEETFPVQFEVKTQIPYQVKTFEWCARVPPRCPVYKTEYRPGFRNETRNSTKIIRVCCEGFAEYEGKCVSQIIHYHLVNPSKENNSNSTQKIEVVNSPASIVTAGQSATESSSPGLWIGLCFALLMVIGVFMLLLFRYKKKLLQVKEELNYVTYTTDRGSNGNLENPVYATVNPNDSSIPNNSVRNFVVNDLKSCNTSHKMLTTASSSAAATSMKSSNLETAAALKKTQELEGRRESFASSEASGGNEAITPLKPLNPNLYHSINDSKDAEKEPIYEEVAESVSSGRPSVYSEVFPPETPVKSHSRLSNSNSIHSTNSFRQECNDLSGQSVYDRPRPSNLNISLSSPPPSSSSTPIKRLTASPSVDAETSSSSHSFSSRETGKKLARELTANRMIPQTFSIDLEGREPQNEKPSSSPSSSSNNTSSEEEFPGRETSPVLMETSFNSDNIPSPVIVPQQPLDARDKRPANEAIYSLDVNATQEQE